MLLTTGFPEAVLEAGFFVERRGPLKKRISMPLFAWATSISAELYRQLSHFLRQAVCGNDVSLDMKGTGCGMKRVSVFGETRSNVSIHPARVSRQYRHDTVQMEDGEPVGDVRHARAGYPGFAPDCCEGRAWAG